MVGCAAVAGTGSGLGLLGGGVEFSYWKCFGYVEEIFDRLEILKVPFAFCVCQDSETFQEISRFAGVPSGDWFSVVCLCYLNSKHFWVWVLQSL